MIYPAGASTGGQWDSQISVDPVDGRTVYASFMQNNKSDIIVAKSTDNGNTWSTKVDVSTAPTSTHHNFPAIAAIGNGDVRISWMDSRAANGGLDRWNVYYRSSSNSGSTWSSEAVVSSFASGTRTFSMTDSVSHLGITTKWISTSWEQLTSSLGKATIPMPQARSGIS